MIYWILLCHKIQSLGAHFMMQEFKTIIYVYEIKCLKN